MKSIGQAHNELLEFMMKNHDITNFKLLINILNTNMII